MHLARVLLLFVASVAAASVLMTAACGSAALTSGVVGQVLCNGGPAPGDWPLANVKVEVHAGSLAAPVTAMVKADAKGHFRIALAPGHYTLIMHRYDDHYRSPTSVTVSAGVFSTVRVMNGVR